jgi:hypothetical protein
MPVLPGPLLFTKRVLYNLKRRYGTPADWYHVLSTQSDAGTGKNIVNKQKFRINRAIVMPVALSLEMNLLGGYRRVDNASSGMPSPPTLVDTRYIILDGADIPKNIDITATAEDYIIELINNQRYNIQKISTLEGMLGHLITARFVKGGVRNEFFDLTASDSLIFNEVTTEPWDQKTLEALAFTETLTEVIQRSLVHRPIR